MQGQTVLGIVVLLAALTAQVVLVVWCRWIIKRIESGKLTTARDISRELGHERQT